MSDYASWRARLAREEAQRRHEERRFHIIMGAVFGTFLLLFGAFVWYAVATEPQRRAAYMTNCESKGFTPSSAGFCMPSAHDRTLTRRPPSPSALRPWP